MADGRHGGLDAGKSGGPLPCAKLIVFFCYCEQTADTAGLTLVQRQTFIRLRELYLRNVGILARRRQQLTSVLQVGAVQILRLPRDKAGAGNCAVRPRVSNVSAFDGIPCGPDSLTHRCLAHRRAGCSRCPRT